IEHKIPIDTIATQTYGSNYEAGLRDAFFRIAWRYPDRVLKAFLYNKPAYIFWSIGASIAFDLGSYSAIALGLLIAAVAVLLLNLIAAAPPLPQMRRIGGVAILCAACSIPPLIAVWALPDTSADLLFFCFF